MNPRTPRSPEPPTHYAVQYPARHDRFGRLLGFQPTLGPDTIPGYFGSIKGARAAARRRWGRVR